MRHDDREQFEAAQMAHDEEQLRRGREMVSSACGGRPDFDGFIAALRAEADGSEKILGPNAQEKLAEIEALRRLADKVERIGERYGFI